MRTAACLVAAIVMSGAFVANGRAEDTKNSLQQRLSTQLSLTQVASDRSQIVNAGTLLTLQKDNLLLYSSACPSSPVSTYKNGKLSQSFGHNFMRDLGGSLQMSEGATTADCPQHRFVRGTTLWVTKIDVRRDAIVFQLYCNPDNNIPYYGDLRFPFEKGSLPTPEQALGRIAEVLTVEQTPEPAPTPSPTPPPTPTPVPPPKLPSNMLCVSAQAREDQLQMNSDHTFSLQEAGQTYRGTFAQNGSTLELTIADTNTKTTATIQGNSLTDSSGQTWVCRVQSAGTAPAGALFQNGDVIKMAKAGFDDGIIIAKISSSKCQFDTQTDALIRLKQSGVSAAVLKAMLGAGR